MAKRVKKSSEPVGARRAPVALDLTQVIDQPRAVEILRNAVASGRIHHAWMFHGPFGVGKFTAALGFAVELLTPIAGPPEEVGKVRELARTRSHPDLHVVTRELASISRDEKVRASKQRTIAKEVLQEFLIEPAQRSAVLSTGSPASKVFIVDEAEILDSPQQNAILKTMEEPPPGTVIILVTRHEERLLATIRSRCQRVGFSTLEAASLRAWSERFHPGIEALTRDWLLGACDGSPGEFEMLLASGVSAWREVVGPMLSRAVDGNFPVELGPSLSKLVDDRAKAVVEAGDVAGKDAANRIAAGQAFRLLAGELRREMRARVQRGESAEACLRGIDAVREGERLLENNVRPEFAFEQIAVRLASA